MGRTKNKGKLQNSCVDCIHSDPNDLWGLKQKRREFNNTEEWASVVKEAKVLTEPYRQGARNINTPKCVNLQTLLYSCGSVIRDQAHNCILQRMFLEKFPVAHISELHAPTLSANRSTLVLYYTVTPCEAYTNMLIIFRASIHAS
jgi:hypothetical protein